MLVIKISHNTLICQSRAILWCHFHFLIIQNINEIEKKNVHNFHDFLKNIEWKVPVWFCCDFIYAMLSYYWFKSEWNRRIEESKCNPFFLLLRFSHVLFVSFGRISLTPRPTSNTYTVIKKNIAHPNLT